MKKTIAFLLVLLLWAIPAYADGEEDFSQAEELIKQKISCDQLTDDQLEMMGDYYMEQMHPGELHEIMDERMGGEGSESLRQAHINMARSFYCGDNEMYSGYMMGMMMGSGYNQGGTNMMGTYNYGMMGGTGFWGMTFYGLIYVALAAFVFGVVFWATYKLVINNKKR